MNDQNANKSAADLKLSRPLTLDEFDGFVRAYADARPGDVVYEALGVCGGAGEVVEVVKKSMRPGAELDVEALTEELGDVLYYVSRLAQTCELGGLAGAASGYKRGYSRGRALDRDALRLGYEGGRVAGITSGVLRRTILKTVLQAIVIRVRHVATHAGIEFDDILRANVVKIGKRQLQTVTEADA